MLYIQLGSREHIHPFVQFGDKAVSPNPNSLDQLGHAPSATYGPVQNILQKIVLLISHSGYQRES